MPIGNCPVLKLNQTLHPCLCLRPKPCQAITRLAAEAWCQVPILLHEENYVGKFTEKIYVSEHTKI